MKGYVISICFALLFCSAAELVIPSKKYTGIIKIVCGIFVVGVIVSPIKNLIKIDYTKYDTDLYLTDDYGFFSKVNKSRDTFLNELMKNSSETVENEISKEIGAVFGVQIRFEFDGQRLMAYGAQENSKEEISKYILKHYELETSFAD